MVNFVSGFTSKIDFNWVNYWCLKDVNAALSNWGSHISKPPLIVEEFQTNKSSFSRYEEFWFFYKLRKNCDWTSVWPFEESVKDFQNFQFKCWQVCNITIACYILHKFCELHWERQSPQQCFWHIDDPFVEMHRRL